MNFFEEESNKLSEAAQVEALQVRLDDGTFNDKQAGIAKQILGRGIDSLSPKQEYTYKTFMKPTLVERCGLNGCPNVCLAGQDICAMCKILY